MTVVDGKQSWVIDPADRWSADAPVVHLTGVQAVVRALIDVLRADRAAGHSTAAFVSGYQGSPLAGFDQEVARSLHESLGVEIVHRPAVNEELGVTAVMGSQLAGTLEGARLDGVLGVWYGKSPGLDRSVDALRHANYAGAAPLGGAVALVGDDPSAKSSTLPSASEGVLLDLAMPTLFPSSLAQILELVPHAVALSRWTGAWVGFKLVTSVADAEGTATIVESASPMLPAGDGPAPVSGDLLTPATIGRESTVLGHRLEAAARYGDLNQLNRITVDSGSAKVAIAAAGTVYVELLESLRQLGLDAEALRTLGIRLGEVRMPFPVGPEFAGLLADGVEEVIVLEERRDVVESQLLSLLGRRAGHPVIVGRLDEEGRPFVPRHGSLDAATMARLLATRLQQRFGSKVGSAPPVRSLLPLAGSAARVPWFCSGCPHSVSTVVPDGTLVAVGIGCHAIVNYMPPGRVGTSIGVTQMGGEGAQWIGMAPFVAEPHIVANMGDGTFFHSGQLSLRAAVGAGVSITYKVLWNGAAAMTGGQAVVGAVASPVELAQSLRLEGVTQIVITTDDLSRYKGRRLPPGTTVRPRDDVVPVQEELAAVAGVTVMIHDQACATELRRARKRGLATRPSFRVVINERVCEGCGDCQVKSNCLSLQTIDTPFGPKTRIDASSCNVDLACLQGDCPAFTLVRDDGAIGSTSSARSAVAAAPPTVERRSGSVAVRVAGIGGTGVVTTANLLAWAAMIDGLEVSGLDQTGMSQKAGPVISDVRIGPGAAERSNILGEGQVDVLLAADLMAAARPSVLAGASSERTAVVGSLSPVMSGPMVLGERQRRVPIDELRAEIEDAAAPGRATFVDATAVAVEAGCPASSANVVLLGVAAELGLLPVTVTALTAAIERNGVAVDQNLDALAVGRGWVSARAAGTHGRGPSGGRHGHPRLADAKDAALPPLERAPIVSLAAELSDYQNDQLSSQFLRLVSEARDAEQRAGGDGAFTEAVERGYYKLLAYKDEYEVARLLLDHPSTDGATTWLLHPPALRSLGLGHKIHLKPWTRPVLRGLRAARRVRGSRLDAFGRTPLRREERRLPIEYAITIRDVLPRLTPDNLGLATEIARLPELVRGYESVKEHSLIMYGEERTRRLRSFDDAG